VPVANCPSCGGPINFSIGSSVVVICDYCRSVVARTDIGVQDLGKVAVLVDTGSPLRRDLPGKYKGVGFRITGRTQMRHAMGGVWDEWYAAFDDGRWGWLAEAQGRYYVTFKSESKNVPTAGSLNPGDAVHGMIVDETGTATLISGEGEIPWRVEPESTYDYADLSGREGRFATIDYSEEPPLLFAGEQTSLEALGINIALEPGKTTRVKVEKLACSNCGGPLNLVAPDQAQRIICPNCGGVHDVSEGNLQYLDSLGKKGPKPLIPLGTKGNLEGDEYILAGFQQRSVTYDRKYFWHEYLLFHPKTKSFRWLIESDGHWSFGQSIASAEVDDPQRNGAAKTVQHKGKTFRIFADAIATTEWVSGEFYWRVEVGETARAVDYIAPPQGLSKEIIGSDKSAEIQYTLAHYVKTDDVAKAFGVKKLPPPRGVGMIQPFEGGAAGKVWSMLFLALIAVALFIGVTRARRQVFNETIRFDDVTTPAWGADLPAGETPPPQPPPTNNEHSRTIFTKPFTLTGGRNLMVDGYSDVSNNWVYVGGDIVNESTGQIESFDLPIEYYEGYDQGEHWTEGSHSKTVFIPAMPAGTYTMRLEGQWAGSTPPAVRVEVREGVFRWSHFFLALFLISLPALWLGMRRGAFETKRWAEASFTPTGRARD
jgi:hypothetical protein